MFDKYKYAVSSSRLEAYRRSGDNDLETLTRCLWNISLCESLYPTLQHFEVGLRNALHRAADANFRDSFWFKRPFLDEKAKEDVAEAEDELNRRDAEAKAARVIDEGRIIAELKFGFWTRLFSRRYEATLWNNKKFPNTAFPGATNKDRLRQNLAQRVDRVRRLRNRVFHHEPILKLNLQKHYDEILEMMNWIEPELRATNFVIDRFPTVFQANYYLDIKQRLAANS